MSTMINKRHEKSKKKVDQNSDQVASSKRGSSLSILNKWKKSKKQIDLSFSAVCSNNDAGEFKNTTWSSTLPKRPSDLEVNMLRTFSLKRDLEKKKRSVIDYRYTPQCSRAYKWFRGEGKIKKQRTVSSNVLLEVLSSDEDASNAETDAAIVPSTPKPSSRMGVFPIQRPKVSSAGCISNESGYGTMTRPGATLRPRNGSDDDVFAQRNSARLSNGDFPNENGLYVEALWDHVTMDDDELGFKVGDVIRVIDMSNADWWWGELDSYEGWFPATFVRILVNQHRDESEIGDVIPHSDDETLSTSSHEYFKVTNFGDDICQCTEKSSTSSVHCAQCGRPFQGVDLSPTNRNPIKITNRKPSTVAVNFNSMKKNIANRDHIRKNVIKEIVNSEKVFAGHLKDVIEGYLTRCQKRPDMFSEEQLSILFGNIQEIYDFQQKFASELEAKMNKTSIHKTELGNIFLNHISGFSIYSEYCNNHPQALALLSQLLVVKKYVHFFEACRLLQKMIDIPLDGFLLTPVQKICKYPLQLAELLKYTSPDHPDHKPVQSSLDAMKDVARMINERKRMMENINKISLWQSSIFNWQGEDVLLKSNELVYSGEVYASSQLKNKPKLRMAFLFDKQIIVCKKDLLRKDLLHYKSRISLQQYDIIPVEKSSPRSSTYMSGDWSSSGSTNTQCGWKITNSVSGESSVMMCKHEKVFDKWMNAFTQERQITLSSRDADMKKELMKDLQKPSLTAPRKPKEFGYIRAPQSFRYRNKVSQENNQASNHQIVNPPPEKHSVSFFSSVAGKLTPFRRATVRETNTVV